MEQLRGGPSDGNHHWNAKGAFAPTGWVHQGQLDA